MLTPVYHTYADVTMARQYLSGTDHAAAWTSDELLLRRTVESVSRRMEQYIGGRSWGPRTETHQFDIGRGSLRDDARLRTRSGVLPLDDWLVSATTVTSYHDTERSAESILTEGVAAGDDYLLEPYNESPKSTLKLSENASETFYGGQKTLQIVGVWGWQDVVTARTTIAGAIGSETETTFMAADGSLLAVGQTVRINSEDFYITQIAANTVTVVRGVNGSTASAHAAADTVSVVEYPPDVIETCLQLASNRWSEREAGGDRIGSIEADIQRPGVIEDGLLKRIRWYRGQRERGGAFF